MERRGTPVAEIPNGARFRHWRYGPVTVVYSRPVRDEQGRLLVWIGLRAAFGEIADTWRPAAQIRLIKEG